MKRFGKYTPGFLLIIVFAISISNLMVVEKKKFSFEDAMKFRSIQFPTLSEDGKWVVYSTMPDRGDPVGYIQNVGADSIKFKVDRGISPSISTDGKWVGFLVRPKAVDIENADKDKPKNGMALVNLSNGKIVKYDKITKFSFSNNSKWLVYQFADDISKSSDSKKPKIVGTDMVLRYLESGSELIFPNVTDFAFDSTSSFLAYVVSEPTGKRNGLYSIDISNNSLLPNKIIEGEKAHYSSLKWNNGKHQLGFIASKERSDGEPDSCELYVWMADSKELQAAVKNEQVPAEWFIPFNNSLKWTKDGSKLFFGLKPLRDTVFKEDKIVMNDSNYYDINTILKKTDLVLWHWQDPRIKSNQKDWWGKNKDKTYRAVYDTYNKKFLQLADLELPYVVDSENPNYTIGYNDNPYLKAITWNGEYKDLYLINLNSGAKKLIASNLIEDAYISPLGKFTAYYKDKNWFLYDNATDSVSNLTGEAGVAFYDEDYDQPSPPPSYGFAGWVEGDISLMLYDKYDIWKFYTERSVGYLNITNAEGRISDISFRIYELDPNKYYYTRTDNFYVNGFHEKKKYYGIFTNNVTVLGPEKIISEENKRFRLIARAKRDNTILMSRESYDEFPDLWVADTNGANPRKITDVNPQMKDYLWGTTELVEWTAPTGDTLEGYIIKPENFQQGQRYPVLIYFYERFSYMKNFFMQPMNNHRPCYQNYNSDGYVIFVPDIKYKVGSPGRSAYNCITSGVRKLIDMGIADSAAIGIQGHSWGGYQTAYLITQTNIFAAAAAGAPVGNMTSAYSGIRLESGMARQFQYEGYQSRIGGNLWDSLNAYINNSPVFQAKNVQTPLLIMFGDEDDAVPWSQGIELYLAMRRLNKNCVMLEYEKEPHIPRKYQNRLDYAIRMKDFFDTYLKKKPAPDWLTKGIEYREKSVK